MARWPLVISIDMSADSAALAGAFGLPLNVEAGGQARMTMRVDITDVNDPDISVERPIP